MWDLPGPGLEPVSTALAGGLLTTALPGKSYSHGFESHTDWSFDWMIPNSKGCVRMRECLCASGHGIEIEIVH